MLIQIYINYNRLEVEDPNWCPESDLYDFDDANYNNKNVEKNENDEQNDSNNNIKSFYESKKSTKKIVKLNSSNCKNKSKFDQIINENIRNNKAMSQNYDSEDDSNENNSTLFYY
jgi:hypothetical protein